MVGVMLVQLDYFMVMDQQICKTSPLVKLITARPTGLYIGKFIWVFGGLSIDPNGQTVVVQSPFRKGST